MISLKTSQFETLFSQSCFTYFCGGSYLKLFSLQEQAFSSGSRIRMLRLEISIEKQNGELKIKTLKTETEK